MLRHRVGMITLGWIVALPIGGAGCSDVLPPTAPRGNPGVVAESATGAGARDTSSLAAQPQGTPGARDFYPLSVGETRRYLHTVTSQTIWENGDSGAVRTESSTYVRRVVCVEQRDGESYYVESFQRGDRIYYWLRYRQDRSGLFADYSMARIAPECEAGLVGSAVVALGSEADKMSAERAPTAYRRSTVGAFGVPGEVTVLQYPLHTRARWLRDRTDPESEAVVEGIDVINVPAGRYVAWRIRLPEKDPGGQSGLVWYSRDGFIKQESGGSYAGWSPLGGNYRVVSTQSEVLASRAIELD